MPASALDGHSQATVADTAAADAAAAASAVARQKTNLPENGGDG